MKAIDTQKGSGTLSVFVITFACLLAVAIATGMLVYVSCLHRAHSASDLAALAAASQAMESLDDSFCCASARQIAHENGSQLTRCDIVRAGAELVAQVDVSVDIPWKVPGLPGEVSSTSYAGNPRTDP